MLKIKMLCLLAALVVTFAGCGFNEGTVQKDSRAFLWFTGNSELSVVCVDDMEPFMLKKKSPNPVHYEVSPGKHRVVVKRNGEVFVNRVIIVGSGAVKEIRIP